MLPPPPRNIPQVLLPRCEAVCAGREGGDARVGDEGGGGEEGEVGVEEALGVCKACSFFCVYG